MGNIKEASTGVVDMFMIYQFIKRLATPFNKWEAFKTGVIDARLSSGALGLPVGATTERPDTPESGYTRWNSTNNAMEIYTGNDWAEVVTDYFPTGSTNVS